MPFDASTIVALIGALGIGSVIGQWLATSKDRRTARAVVLERLAAAEEARWFYQDGRGTADAKRAESIRSLETAALVARVPRDAVRMYAQMATAASWEFYDNLEEVAGSPEEAGINAELSDVVLDLAKIVSDATWTSPATRWLWLKWRLRRVEKRISAIKDSTTTRLIESARRHVR